MDDTQYWDQGVKQIDQLVLAVNGIVDSFSEPRRSQVHELLKGPVGTGFFTAPASTKRGYHCAFPAGLVVHSLNVVRNAVLISQSLAPGRWSMETVMFCALFHDLGKAGDGKDPYYVQTKELWRSERGYNYEINSAVGYHFVPSSELGVYTLLQNGVTMTREEIIAIRLNDGPAAEGNVDYAFREPDLAVLINMADNWAMRAEKAADLV